MTPTVSIVMPTYNQANYLPMALDGIISQTYKDFELIVVNDGATDHTSAVLGEYRSRLNFRLVEQANQGLPKALNTGFELAAGRFLTWTSSDNIMLPQMLDVLVEALSADPKAGLVYADWICIDETGKQLMVFPTLDHDRHILMRVNYVNCCFLYRRECMEKIGGYDPGLIYSEDWDYWIRFSRLFGMKRIPKFLYQYRVHAGSMTADAKKGTARQRIKFEGFDARLRRQAPFDWYISKIKWRWLCWFKRRDLNAEWNRIVEESVRV